MIFVCLLLAVTTSSAAKLVAYMKPEFTAVDGRKHQILCGAVGR